MERTLARPPTTTRPNEHAREEQSWPPRARATSKRFNAIEKVETLTSNERSDAVCGVVPRSRPTILMKSTARSCRVASASASAISTAMRYRQRDDSNPPILRVDRCVVRAIVPRKFTFQIWQGFSRIVDWISSHYRYKRKRSVSSFRASFTRIFV